MSKKKTKKKVIKRGASKITTPLMGEGAVDQIEAFKCDAQMKSFLKGLENKSDFIRNAILKAASEEVWVTCPTCSGKGQIKQIEKAKKA